MRDGDNTGGVGSAQICATVGPGSSRAKGFPLSGTRGDGWLSAAGQEVVSTRFIVETAISSGITSLRTHVS